MPYKNADDRKRQKQRWAANNPDKVKVSVLKTYLKKLYGLTMEDYQRMLDDSKGLCPICRRPFNLSKNTPHVDHDHEKDCVRGLLCCQCNVGLGMFHDNVESLLNAVEYLRNH